MFFHPARQRSSRSSFAGHLVALSLSLGCLLQAQQPSSSTQIAEALHQGEAALRANNPTRAAEAFQKALKLDPANAEAHANLGTMAFFQSDCVTAEPHFKAVLHVSPDLAKALALLSICERQRGEPSAETDMQNAFDRIDDAKLRTILGIQLADSYYSEGDMEHAESVLHTLLNISPDNVDVLFFAQRVYGELADNTLNKLAVLAPGSARMEQLIANRLINAGDLKGAMEHYRKAMQLAPRLPGLHYELAQALLEGNPNDAAAQKQALAELDAARQTDGDTSGVECQFGRVALLQNDLPRAFQHFQSAHQMDPASPEAQIGMADIYRRQGKLEEAAKYLHMAVSADPMNPEPHYKLAQVEHQLHLDDESKREMQLFLDLRDTRAKVRTLYRQMAPQTAAEDAASRQLDSQPE
jgi:tetratricopeptide (TPR) repeat protein